MKLREKNFNIKPNLFIDVKLSVFLALFFGLLHFTKFLNIPFPNFLLELTNSKAELILGNVIGAASSILGIVIAILIISIEFLGRKFDDYSVKVLLTNRKLRNVTTLFVFSIIFSFITIILLPQNGLSDGDFNRVYFSLALFLVAFVYLFASLHQIINSSKPQEIINSLLKHIDKTLVLDFIKSHKEDLSIHVTKKESNPLIQLQVISILAVRNDDEGLLEQILVYRFTKLKEVIEDSIENSEDFYHPMNIIDTYVHYLLEPICDRAIANGNRRLVNLIIDEGSNLSIFCAQHRLTVHMRSITGYMFHVLPEQLLRERYYECVRVLLESYHDILSALIFSFDKPISSKVLGLISYPQFNLSEEDERQEALKINTLLESNDILNLIDKASKVLEKSIELSDRNIIHNFVVGCNKIMADIQNLGSLTENEKGGFVIRLSKLLKRAAIKFVSSGFGKFNDDDLRLFFPLTIVTFLFPKNTSSSTIPFRYYLDTITELSISHPIEDDLFDDSNNKINYAMEHFIDNLLLHRDSVVCLLDALQKLKENTLTLTPNKIYVVNAQIVKVKEALQTKEFKDNIIDSKISLLLA